MMKTFLLGAAGLIALGMAAPAAAADLPMQTYTKAPPAYMAAIYDWSGFYVGANAGWGTTRKCWDFTNPAGVFLAAEGCHNSTGAVAGGQIGYRLQSGPLVYGLEAQGDWAGLSGSNTSLAFGTTNRTRVDAFGLFTGQIGFAWNNALLYAKGGAAVTTSRYDVLFAGTTVASAKENGLWGGTAGAGVEYGFTPAWSAALEYDHLFMGSRLYAFTTTAGGLGFGTDRIRGDVDLVTARINYHFGPDIPKY